MIILYRNLSILSVKNHGNVDFSSANLTVSENNNLKSWEVSISGAEDFKTRMFIDDNDYFDLTMIDENGKEYNGAAIFNGDDFIGTGALNF